VKATHDVEFFKREIDRFLPDRIYDAHTHIWKPEFYSFSDQSVDWTDYQSAMTSLHGTRPTYAMFIPFVGKDSLSYQLEANEWAAQQKDAHPYNRCNFFVKPEDDSDWILEHATRLGATGLKCYHHMANTSPTWEADIQAFLPEHQVRLCHEQNWFITLHIVKKDALANDANIECIRYYCQKYPQMQLILAHSARAFQPTHNLRGLPKLQGLPNLWFDSSANCEPMAHQAIFRILGHERFMYGCDYPVSHLRGRSLGVADSFLWLYEDTPVWGEKHAQINPVLVGLEHLRSLKWACWSEKLTENQIEDIFWNNAARLFHLEDEA
jgi:glutamate-1-semialdehyde 2,1-aminomutase